MAYGERGSCSERAIVPSGHAGPKDERFPQFTSPARRAVSANRLPHSPALPVAHAIPDPGIPFSGRLVIFHKHHGDEDDLRTRNPDRRTAELRNAVDGTERRQIQAELATAEAKFAEEEAAFDAMMIAEPPH